MRANKGLCSAARLSRLIFIQIYRIEVRTMVNCYVCIPNRKSDPSRGFVSRMRFNLGNWLWKRCRASLDATNYSQVSR